MSVIAVELEIDHELLESIESTEAESSDNAPPIFNVLPPVTSNTADESIVNGV